MKNITFIRTFWPVGHGAFYTEGHFCHSSDKSFCAVYDCGGNSKSTIERQIESFLIRNSSTLTINYLFISHFHRDHINGLHYLLSHAEIEHIVIPQLEATRLIEAYVYNAITADNIDDVQDDAQFFIRRRLATNDINVKQIIEVEAINEERQPFEPRENNNGFKTIVHSGYEIEVFDDDNDIPYWVYIPVNIDFDYVKRQQLVTELNKICKNCAVSPIIKDGEISWSSIDTILDKNVEDVKKAYNNIFGDNHNAYSMPVFSGPKNRIFHTHLYDSGLFEYYMNSYSKYYRNFNFIHYRWEWLLSCLYMGDFEANNRSKLNQLKKSLNRYYHQVGMQQVPHHYSAHNHEIDLYEDRIVAFGNVDDHKDISFCHSVYNEIFRGTYLPPLIITEESIPYRYVTLLEL